MAANRIPDELISEILSPLLHVSDASFSTLNSVAGVSPFLTFSESSSSYLAVSKSWLRVATPLLYNVVVIRSKAQAQALAATLNADPDLGRFIKKLRVEGGYDMFMHTITQRASQLTDLFMSLQLDPGDDGSGLCLGLPLLNPIRVIVDAFSEVFANGAKLFEVLRTCIIGQWSRLTQLEMPLNFARQNLSKALSQVPLLDKLVVWSYQDWLRQVPEYISAVSENPALKKIQLIRIIEERDKHDYYPHKTLSQYLYGQFQTDPRLAALLHLKSQLPDSTIIEDPSTSMEDTSAVPFTYPARLRADALEDLVWGRILSFVLYSDVPEKMEDGWRESWRHRHAVVSSRLSALLVCKMFARLGVPHLYTVIVLRSENAAQSLKLQLKRHPEFGLRVRVLCMDFYSESNILGKLVVHTPALTEFHGRYAPWRVFENFAEVAGDRLQVLAGLAVSSTTGAADPGTLALFQRMTSLHWDSKIKFRSAQKLKPETTFSILVNLTVNEFHESFFDVLEHAELPSLQSVSFNFLTNGGGASFFKKHGSKLRELKISEKQLTSTKLAIWSNCPSLTILHILFDEQNPVSGRCLVTSETLPLLKQISFEVFGYLEKFKWGHEPHFNRLVACDRVCDCQGAMG
ncbi:hypothetical protein R3P38DRAFT_2876178 [Favolaschia claudopus]|uniref:F-box domain-containing protein n=1 Tax=Favolaschia claudopus TaxID=2862362 RepID=A0AAW0D6D1_9AGAR